MIYFTKGLHIKLHPTEITEAQTASGVWFVVALNDLVERCWWISVCEGSPFHLPASDVNWLIQQILVINPHFVNLCCFGSRSVNAGCIWEKQSHCFASLRLCMCDWILTQNVLFAVDGLNVLIYVCVCVCVSHENRCAVSLLSPMFSLLYFMKSRRMVIGSSPMETILWAVHVSMATSTILVLSWSL